MGDGDDRWQRRHRSLLGFFRRVGSVEDGEDLAQDTWVRYWRHAARASVAEPDALLRVMARRVWIDYLRGRRRSQPSSEQPSDGLPGPDFSDGFASRLDLLAALKQLPREDRQLIRWRFEEGQRLDHIAQRLHITPAACRQRLVRALRRLRQIMDEPPSPS